MSYARRLAIVETSAFAIPFLVALPLHWMSSDVQDIVLMAGMVLTICASLLAAHSTGLFAVLIAPAVIVSAVAGVYLGGYAPYALHIGGLEPSEYGCCDLGTGADGVWARIVYGSTFGGMVGAFMGFILWLVEFLYGEVKEMIKETEPDGTLRR